MPNAPSAVDRLLHLLCSLDGDTLQKVALLFGMPFCGEQRRELAAEELIEAIAEDGRKGVSLIFDAIPSPELRRLARQADLPIIASRKAAYVTSLILGYLLPPSPAVGECLAAFPRVRDEALHPDRFYQVLRKHHDKKGLQQILMHLDQPRSGKNKDALIRRISETVYWKVGLIDDLQ